MSLPLMKHILISYNRSALVQCVGSIIEAIQVRNIEDHEEEQSKRVVEPLFTLLFERIYDVNSFTRSMVCRVLSRLVETHAIPILKYNVLTRLAMDRLQDKTAVVRKSALQLLTQLIDYNPHSPQLDMQIFNTKKTQLEQSFERRRAELLEWYKTHLESEDRDIFLEKSLEEQLEFLSNESIHIDDDEIKSLTLQIQFSNDGMEFISICHQAVLHLSKFLNSKTNSDISESLKLLTHGINFSVPDSARIFQR